LYCSWENSLGPNEKINKSKTIPATTPLAYTPEGLTLLTVFN